MAIRDLVPRRRRGAIVREEERPIEAFQREMNRLFDEFMSGSWPALYRGLEERWPAFAPRVDVTETENELHISAELPGIDAKDVDVSISKDMLTIRGEKREEQEEKGRNYYRTERSYGSFQRMISLPAEVDSDKVEATFKNGVLSITLPKTVEARHQTKIAVKTE